MTTSRLLVAPVALATGVALLGGAASAATQHSGKPRTVKVVHKAKPVHKATTHKATAVHKATTHKATAVHKAT
ncbi:MAG: hypothetical protein JWM85_1204, partial [Acidimicrobiaceae bacterium]|nr:hypothetical protein [Acidimicrobiaceae bacterium]